MATHRNLTFTEWSDRIFRFKTGEGLSSEVMPNIQPVVEIAPIQNIARSATTTASAATVIYATPSDRDFYLCSATLGYEKNAACDNAGFSITATIGGVSQSIVRVASLTLTASTNNEVMLYTPALKIDRGTNISLNGTFAAGACNKVASISGYTTETLTSYR